MDHLLAPDGVTGDAVGAAGGEKVAAAVPYHGIVTGEQVEAFQYPAGHAFANEENLIGTYDPEAARAAWDRTLGFLGAPAVRRTLTGPAGRRRRAGVRSPDGGGAGPCHPTPR